MRRSPTEERLLAAFHDAVQADIEVDRITHEEGSSEKWDRLARAQEDLTTREDQFLQALRDYNKHVHSQIAGQLHTPLARPQEL